jgi:hypothetical protein
MKPMSMSMKPRRAACPEGLVMSDVLIVVLSLVGSVFAVSATAKLAGRPAYRSFRDGLGEARVIPGRLLPSVALLLCAAEAATAGCLISAGMLVAAGTPGAFPLAGAGLGAAAVLSAVLAGGVALVIRRGTRARCSCFGAASSRPLGRVHLVRNLALLAVACAGLAAAATPSGHPAPATLLLAVGGGVAGALVFIRWDDLADLFTPIAPSPPGQAPNHSPAHAPRQEER